MEGAAMRSQRDPSLAVVLARLALFPRSASRRDCELLLLELVRCEWVCGRSL